MSNPFNHYKIHKPEPLDLILKYNLNFIEGNIVKYVLRSRFKGHRVGDLKKALEYALIIDISQIQVRFPQFDFEKELQEYKELDLIEKTIIGLIINGLKSYSDKEVLIDYLKMAIGDRDHNHKKEELNSKFKIKRFSIHGKFFNTFEEMREYAKNWGDLSLDIDEFKKQMNIIIKCFENISKKISPTFSNKDAYIGLRSYTDWAVEDKEDIHKKIECRIHPLSTLFAIIEMNPIDFLETIACTECEKEENELSFYLKLIDMIEGDEDFLSLLEKIGYGDKEFWKHRYDIFWNEAKKRYLCKGES